MSNKLTFNGVLDEMNANQVSSEAIRFMERLRDIYAPTIEMTEEAYNELNKLRSHNYDLDIVNSRAMFEYNPLKQCTTEELAQAWLHPDTIKVKE